jgi:hypothetical protein
LPGLELVVREGELVVNLFLCLDRGKGDGDVFL